MQRGAIGGRWYLEEQQVGGGKLDYVRIYQGTNGWGKVYDAENVCEDRGMCLVGGNGVESRSRVEPMVWGECMKHKTF
jgi:hypothetical protein